MLSGKAVKGTYYKTAKSDEKQLEDCRSDGGFWQMRGNGMTTQNEYRM